MRTLRLAVAGVKGFPWGTAPSKHGVQCCLRAATAVGPKQARQVGEIDAAGSIQVHVRTESRIADARSVRRQHLGEVRKIDVTVAVKISRRAEKSRGL